MASSFSHQRNPHMEKALFDWPIVLQYDLKAKYRLISTKFFGHEVFFQPRVRLTNRKLSRARFVSVGQTSEIALFPFVCSLCIVRAFSFQGHTKTLYRKDQYATCGVCSSQPTLSNDPGKVDSIFFCYAATVLSPHRKVLIFTQRMHKPT